MKKIHFKRMTVIISNTLINEFIFYTKKTCQSDLQEFDTNKYNIVHEINRYVK